MGMGTNTGVRTAAESDAYSVTDDDHRQPQPTKGTDMKKQTSAPETVRSDQALVQVTLTLAVETYLCDTHSDQAHEIAVETVLDALTGSDSEIVVLASDFTRLTLTKADRS